MGHKIPAHFQWVQDNPKCAVSTTLDKYAWSNDVLRSKLRNVFAKETYFGVETERDRSTEKRRF